MTGKREVHNEERKNDISTRSVSYDSNAGISGYGIGKVVIISDGKPEYKQHTVTDTDAELQRFENAMEVFVEKTQKMADAMKEKVGGHNAEILEGHIVLMSDPFMQDQVKELIGNGECAEAAVDSVCDMFVSMFSQVDDELTRQRATVSVCLRFLPVRRILISEMFRQVQ